MRRIACSIVNGIKLRLFKEGFDDGTGKCQVVAYGDPVTLNGPSARAAGTSAPSAGEPCITLVSDEFWDQWRGQNEGKNPLLDLGHIYDLDAKREEAEDSATVPES